MRDAESMQVREPYLPRALDELEKVAKPAQLHQYGECYATLQQQSAR